MWSNCPVFFPDGNYASSGSVPNMVQMHREGGYRTRDANDMWLTSNAILKPMKNLTINVDYSYNYQVKEELSYWKRMPMFLVDGSISNYYMGTNPSAVTRDYYGDRYYAFNAFGNYENDFGKHNIQLTAGFNQENAKYLYFTAKRDKLMVETIPHMKLAYGERSVSDGASEFAIRGAFYRLSYNFDNRYLLEFNGRYDGSSKFPQKSRFAFFPSFSIGWRLDNEDIFGGLKNSFDMLKLRASYGSLGNQNVRGNYPYISTFSSGEVNYILGEEKPMTAYAPGLVSPILTWEKVTQRNIGVDIAILDNKINASFDIYRRDTKNMLTKSETLPAVLSVSEPRANAADLKTTGFDFTLEGKQRINEVSLKGTLILSDYTGEITRFSNPKGIISDYYEGQKLGEIWGLVTGGIFQTDEEAQVLDQKEISGRERRAGDLFFIDLDGDGKITRGEQTLDNHGDMKIIGNSTPRYSYGFKAGAEWKGFDLEIFLQGVGKQDKWLDVMYWLRAYIDEWKAMNNVLTDWWSPENPDAFYPRPLIEGGSDVTTPQTRWLQNSAYLRLKQLTFGYTVPVNWSRRAYIDRIRIYFSGNNLWELSNIVDNVADPEMTGARYYPIYRSFSFGANINF